MIAEGVIWMANLYKAMQQRRSIYHLSAETTLRDEKLSKLMEDALRHTPSPFNSQSARVVLLVKAQHRKLWEIVKKALQSVVPAEQFGQTEQKIDSFAAGYGTVLYFEDQAVVEGLQANFPLYKDNFPLWSHQSSGMLQYVIWTCLAAEGMGASLQHYNPLIDEAVRQEWQLPESWQLIAQMPFGRATEPAQAKFTAPLEERFRLFQE